MSIARILVSALFVASLAACGAGVSEPNPGPTMTPDNTNPQPNNPAPENPTPQNPTPSNPMMPMNPMNPMNPAPTGPTTVAAGNVSGMWCGTVDVQGSVTIPAGQMLEACAGAMIQLADGASITVSGTLKVSGTAAEHAAFTAAVNRWNGIRVASGGKLDATQIDLSKASLCLDGQPGSTIQISGGSMTACAESFRVANGATMDKTTILGGSTAIITGGVLHMTDSVIDLQHAHASPDCTNWSGGGATLDHVRFTGCHCPIHIDSTDQPYNVTNSIFDLAGVPVMIGGTMNATFTNNNFLSAGSQFLDIGGGVHANVAGNFWSTDGSTVGHAPGISTSNPAQFVGMASYASAPIPGAGPRM